MIARLWHGWTSESNSEAYASLLTATVLPSSPATTDVTARMYSDGELSAQRWSTPC